jgi:hypothetical protein
MLNHTVNDYFKLSVDEMMAFRNMPSIVITQEKEKKAQDETENSSEGITFIIGSNSQSDIQRLQQFLINSLEDKLEKYLQKSGVAKEMKDHLRKLYKKWIDSQENIVNTMFRIMYIISLDRFYDIHPSDESQFLYREEIDSISQYLIRCIKLYKTNNEIVNKIVEIIYFNNYDIPQVIECLKTVTDQQSEIISYSNLIFRDAFIK